MNDTAHGAPFKNGKFMNQHPWEPPSFRDYLSTGWKFMFGSDRRTPSYRLPRKLVDLEPFTDQNRNQLNVTWLGHSSLMINLDGYRILTDPVFEKSVSVFGPTRYNGELPLDPHRLPAIDLVIVSHNHYDHLNKPSLSLLSSRSSRFVVPLAVGGLLREAGIPAEKVTEMDWWQELKIRDDLMVAAAPAQHFSGRSLWDRDKSLWASWVLRSGSHSIFFSGDSGYFDGFKEIGRKYGPFNMTFIETGAYNRTWHHIHMFPEETVQAHVDLQGDVLHPIHWATFNLSLHSWDDPMERLTRAAQSRNVRVATPLVGETTIYDTYIPTKEWWHEEAQRIGE